MKVGVRQLVAIRIVHATLDAIIAVLATASSGSRPRCPECPWTLSSSAGLSAKPQSLRAVVLERGKHYTCRADLGALRVDRLGRVFR